MVCFWWTILVTNWCYLCVLLIYLVGLPDFFLGLCQSWVLVGVCKPLTDGLFGSMCWSWWKRIYPLPNLLPDLWICTLRPLCEFYYRMFLVIRVVVAWTWRIWVYQMWCSVELWMWYWVRGYFVLFLFEFGVFSDDKFLHLLLVITKWGFLLLCLPCPRVFDLRVLLFFLLHYTHSRILLSVFRFVVLYVLLHRLFLLQIGPHKWAGWDKISQWRVVLIWGVCLLQCFWVQYRHFKCGEPLFPFDWGCRACLPEMVYS